MKQLSRRAFLAGLGAAGLGALAGCQLSSSRGSKRSTDSGAPTSRGSGAAGRTLVVVEMQGGNDGLSMVVPHGDPRYRSLRPSLVVNDPIDLDGSIGLHPELAPLKPLWDSKKLAIVEGVGYPEPDLSHFASLAIWWTGDPTGEEKSGWLGRYLNGAGDADGPLDALSVASRPSPMLASGAPAVSFASSDGLTPNLGELIDIETLRAAMERLLGANTDGGLARDVVASQRDAIEASRSLERVLSSTPSLGKNDNDLEARGADAYDSDNIETFELAATLLGAPDPPRVLHVEVTGDFDTHQGHADRYPALAKTVGTGIATMWDMVEKAGRAKDVTIMTVSEFGRRAAENGDGLDHGTAAAHLVIGGKVKGGRYGSPPELDSLDHSGNLVATVDVRAYYATVLAGFLDTDPERILGSGHEPLPVFA